VLLYVDQVMAGSGRQGVLGAIVDKMIRITALTGFAILAAATAHAQGSYNYAISGGPDSNGVLFRPNYSSYSGFYMGPAGDLHSGTVNTYSMNLGGGVSMGLFTTVSNAPTFDLAGYPGNSLVQSFSGTVRTNYANGSYFDPAVGTPSNVSGRLSVGLGGGLSMDFLGGVSRAPGSGFYFGPGSGFDNRMTTTVGTGFSLNLGRGGRLSVSGSMSSGPRVFGAGLP
jgi:hypothetical protein